MSQIEKVLYTAKAQTTGGRDGASRSGDGRLDVKLSSPGSAGNGTNPEQLFAAGWSARLNVSLPGLQPKVAQALVDAAHQLCPYSKATRGNIDVTINLV